MGFRETRSRRARGRASQKTQHLVECRTRKRLPVRLCQRQEAGPLLPSIRRLRHSVPEKCLPLRGRTNSGGESWTPTSWQICSLMQVPECSPCLRLQLLRRTAVQQKTSSCYSSARSDQFAHHRDSKPLAFSLPPSHAASSCRAERDLHTYGLEYRVPDIHLLQYPHT